MSFWAVVQTESRREQAVSSLLARIGIESYLPKIKQRKQVTALFPSYLFVHVVGGWYEIRWLPHVCRLLMTGEVPATVPQGFIDQLHRQERGGFIRLPLPFKQGQRVRILKGSFSGHIAIYHGMTSAQREAVLLELMGRTVQIEMRAGNLNLVG